MTKEEFRKKWLWHIKKPNYSQKKIDELEKDLEALIDYYYTLGQEN